jgi:hypothetical protein
LTREEGLFSAGELYGTRLKGLWGGDCLFSERSGLFRGVISATLGLGGSFILKKDLLCLFLD